MPGEKYEYGIDFDRVAAIDIHTHVEVDGPGHKAYDDELVDAVGKYFKMGPSALSSVDALADEYRRHNTAAVVFTIDARTGMRHVPNFRASDVWVYTGIVVAEPQWGAAPASETPPS